MKPPYLSTAEFAALHDVQAQTVRLWCEGGKIPGAIQVGGRWLVPKDAKRPDKKPTGPKR
jgi:predicted site-specific integrase-resolvase